MEERVYSEIIELQAWELADKSLLPNAISSRSYELFFKYFNYFFWPYLIRMKDKNICFELSRIHLDFSDKEIIFPQDCRLLFQTKLSTIYNKRLIKIEIKVFRSYHPFEYIAACVMVMRETINIDPHDWLGNFPERGAPIKCELKDLAEEPKGHKITDIASKLKQIESKSPWIGPVRTKHTAILHHCECLYVFVFMNYAGPMIELGRKSMLNWLKEKDFKPYPDYLKKKLNYINWKLWMDTRRPLYLNDSFVLDTYYMESGGNYYLKHELYLEKPKLLSTVMLEEYLK